MRPTKHTNIITILAALALMAITGCGNNTNKPALSESKTTNTANDTVQIKDLVRRAYKWYETDTSKNDLKMLTDSKHHAYIGVDLEKQKLHMEELRKTGFFSKEFIDTNFLIAQTIDRKLRNKEFSDEWLVGDLPPFGSDSNPWCNCQDYPSDNPWDKIVFTFVRLTDKTATISWTWDNPEWAKDFNYTIRLVKDTSGWKISWLQGFDYKQLTEQNY